MIEAHPLTNYIPALADHDELVMDIAQNGLLNPLVLYEGKLIEGRVRYRAAREAGTGTPVQDWVLMDTPEKDPLEWMVRRHLETHELTELDRIKLVATLLPYYQQLPGHTTIKLNKATGLSHHKVRNVQYLIGAGKLGPVLAGEQDLLEAGRAIGVVSEKKEIALGKSFGHGDKFDEAVQPLKRYLAAWKRKGYEFRHVNPKEASRRLSLIDSLTAELEAMKPDLEKRAVTASYSAPPEKST